MALTRAFYIVLFGSVAILGSGLAANAGEVALGAPAPRAECATNILSLEVFEAQTRNGEKGKEELKRFLATAYKRYSKDSARGQNNELSLVGDIVAESAASAQYRVIFIDDPDLGHISGNVKVENGVLEIEIPYIKAKPGMQYGDLPAKASTYLPKLMAAIFDGMRRGAMENPAITKVRMTAGKVMNARLIKTFKEMGFNPQLVDRERFLPPNFAWWVDHGEGMPEPNSGAGFRNWVLDFDIRRESPNPAN
jgi:hypothetical protein